MSARASAQPDLSRRRLITLIVASFLAVGLGVASFALPVPYVEISPGETCDTVHPNAPPSQCGRNAIVDVGNRGFPNPAGQLRLTTVSVAGGPGYRRLTLLEALRGWLSGRSAVLPRDLEFPPGQTADEANCQQEADQKSSQNNAITAALRELRYNVPVTRTVYALSVSPGTPAAKAQIGTCSVITSIGGEQLKSRDDLIRLVRQHKPGDVVRVTCVCRDAQNKPVKRSFDVRLAANPGDRSRAFLGISAADYLQSHPPFRVTIQIDNVGGPSAGLMYALAIVDLLTSGSLTGGHIVAGTGTIDAQGEVGPIGGIQQKVLAAKRDHATVFLTPKQNCADAVRMKVKGVRLVSVNSLADALSALAVLRADAAGRVTDC